MAKTIKKESSTALKDDKLDPKISIKSMRQYKVLFGTMLVLIAVALLLSFISFFIYGQQDQNAIDALVDRNETVQNWLGKFGAYVADFFIYKGFGVASFIFVKLLNQFKNFLLFVFKGILQ